MKRWIWVAGLLLCSAAGVSAQSTGAGNASRKKAAVSATGNRASLHKTPEKRVERYKKVSEKVVAQPEPLQEDKIYDWKDGQSATPTGHEAAPVNGQGYRAPRKDSLRRERR
ncbi:hypothetical protein EPD60_11765 [Flaviaesturariibacter flavus]|uniref:DUF680 domain-containing protein n=1 Tax=Flaviaesturariibacter flavus TaxID=2502780 RepID=A0A4R1BA22_9BACT|nr:hypothetical protein [Flaviaesturariibacter flavus]TCJ13764.1 hypothetical protein EPD60_11765 [Flaviaesturariibacter flavus]